MTELRMLWDRVERWAIYGVLLLFLALQLLSLAVPSIGSILDRRGELVLIGFVLIFLFRYLDERLGSREQDSLSSSASFLQGLLANLRASPMYENVDVLAHTGAMYYRAIYESQVKITNLRVLVRDMRNIHSLSLPSEDDARLEIQQEWTRTMKDWEALQRSGKVTNLLIRYYPFEPMVHFAVIDHCVGYMTLMKPQKEFPGATSRYTPTAYTVVGTTPTGRQLVDDLLTEFESIWSEFEG